MGRPPGSPRLIRESIREMLVVVASILIAFALDA